MCILAIGGKADPIFISCRHRDPAITPGEIGWVSFLTFDGVGEGAINLHTDTVGILHHISFDHLQFQQIQSTNDQQGYMTFAHRVTPISQQAWG
ncbi:hypothetical protein P4S72_23805 [Vibrio sp. PP-XX7]